MLLNWYIIIMYSSEDLEINYSENMAADEKDRYIRSLIDKINMFELDQRLKDDKIIDNQ